MDSETINTAVVASIKDSAVPHVDRTKVADLFGEEQTDAIVETVAGLVREAVSMPVDWGNKTLEEGVNDILRRFGVKHPELSSAALHEIGRCVGWNLR